MPHVVGLVDTALAEAARSGDADALDTVVAQCLPLVYSIVRRSLRSNADVDDVVQDVMVSVVRGLGSLREPDRLRAWLAAITVNQIRAYLRSGRTDAFAGPERHEPFDRPDPGSEFVDHALLRLDLSEQRREAARAAGWLEPEHRDLLGLWWLEASGHLTRAELISALGLDPHLATVRIGRMKQQLDGCRQMLRALDAGCPQLTELTADWAGEPSSIWRKRFLRHIRACRRCVAAADGLIPPERLLAGLPLLPLPPQYSGTLSAAPVAGLDHDAPATTPPLPSGHHGARHRTGSHGRGGRGSGSGRRAGSVGGASNAGRAAIFGKPIGLAAVAVAVIGVVAAILVMRPAPDASQHAQPPTGGRSAAEASAPASAGSVVVPTVRASQGGAHATASGSFVASPSPSPSHVASHPSPSTRSTHPAAPVTSQSSTSDGSQSPAQQVLATINQARASAGLQPYTMNADLIKSATAHNDLMANGCGLSHQCSGEPAIGDRETAAGVHWTACGENIGEGGPEPDTQAGMAKMAVSLTDSMLAEQPPNDGHRLNILSSSFAEVGIAVTIDSSGTVWMTQDFSN